jgi:RNA polymerase sigma factor (sigma-70 family)
MSCATFSSLTVSSHQAAASLPRTPLLSAEQERELAFGVADGDAASRDRLVCSNLGLVVTIARHFLGRGLDQDDLVGEGNLGLIRAAQDFKPEFGTRFSTYAAFWIKQAIREALINRSAAIRLPAHMVKLLSTCRVAERALTGELGEAAEFDRVAVSLGLSGAQRNLVDHARRARRLQSGGEEAREDWASDGSPPPEAALERSEAAEDLWARMAGRLDAREHQVVTLRFGLGGGELLTLKETGRRLGVTREWARKLEVRALDKLRDPDPSGGLAANQARGLARGRPGTLVRAG